MTSYLELRKALAEAYPAVVDRRAAATDIGLDPTKIELEGNASTAWSNILAAVRERRRMEEFRTWLKSEEERLIPVFEGWLAEIQSGEFAEYAVAPALAPPNENRPLVRTNHYSGDIHAQLIKEDLSASLRKPLPPFEVESKSPKFVQRQAKMDEMRALLVPVSPSGARVTRAALVGGPGTGKTSLVIAFAHEARAQFPDGVVWARLGKAPDVRGILSGWGKSLKDNEMGRAGYADSSMASARLKTLLRDRACLLLVDDAWDPALIRDFFLFEGPRCMLLITTRVRAVADAIQAAVIDVEEMTEPESLALLENWSGPITKQDLPVAQSLATAVGRVPLALELVGAKVKVLKSWQEYARQWKAQKLKVLKRWSGADDPRDNMQVSIELSISSLRETDRARFLDLALFPEDAEFPASACGSLWGTDDGNAFDSLQEFANQALVSQRLRRDQWQMFLLHDLIREFVMSATSEAALPSIHRRLVEGYKRRCGSVWDALQDDGYVYDHLAYHMAEGHQRDELRDLLTRAWLEAQERRTGTSSPFASDLEVAISTLSAAEDGEFQDLFRWCYARTIIGSQATTVPPELFGTLVHLGRSDQARGVARLITDASRRASAYLRMAHAALTHHQRDAGLEFVKEAQGAINAMRDLGPRTSLLAELASLVRQLAEPSLSEYAVTQLIAEVERDMGTSWAVETTCAAVPALITLGQSEHATRLARGAIGPARHAEDAVKKIGYLVTVATLLRSVGIEDEAANLEDEANIAIEAVNQQLAEPTYFSVYGAKDLVTALVEASDLDGALIVADRWVVAEFPKWSYPHALATVAIAMLSAGRREDATTIAAKAYETARGCLETDEFSAGEGKEALVQVSRALARLGNTMGAAEFSRQIKPDETGISVLASVAEILAECGDSNEARRLTDECLQRLRAVSVNVVAEVAALGYLAQSLARLHETELAQTANHQARSLFVTEEDVSWESHEAGMAVARSLALLGDAQGARAWVGKLRDTGWEGARKVDQELEVAEALLIAGWNAESETSIADIVRTAGKIGDPVVSAHALAGAATVAGRLHHPKRSLSYARKAASQLSKSKPPSDTSSRHEWHANIALAAGAIATHASIKEALSIIELSDKLGEKDALAKVLRRVVEILWDAGKADRALLFARRLFELDPSSGLTLAEALERSGDRDQAKLEACRVLKKLWPPRDADGFASHVALPEGKSR
jgi:hypothetical protein